MRTSEQIVLAIRKNFVKRLARKTGWGRNEVLAQLDTAIREEALRELTLVQEIVAKSVDKV